jgi:EAL domain-containing protein (putative c-di-GMP-specific phosphodiesterase class I)
MIFAAGIDVLRSLDAGGCRLPSMSFNVSAGRLLSPDFIKTIDAVGFEDAGRIAFEILETVSVETEGQALIFVLDALRERGFRIEIDDFGSDHASINGVFSVEPDAVKIDRAITSKALQTDAGRRAVDAIVAMSHSLDLRVVAEGIETEAHAAAMRRAGCDTLQGYFFSKPISGRDLVRYLGNQKIARVLPTECGTTYKLRIG